MQIDLELALLDTTEEDVREIQNVLPSGVFFENKVNLGWGIVIRVTKSLPDNICDAIDIFLDLIRPLKNIINSHVGVLRVAVFYSTYTSTIQLNSFEKLTEFGLKLEISNYPTLDDEEGESQDNSAYSL
ncbi:MAG: hypothetical protein LBE06_06215 [Azoarcus sp.]|jgi:hypothetical protein|nr:hypothetical protein [Azoarcus sp.]